MTDRCALWKPTAFRTWLAAAVCGAPYAQINFIDAERQWTKASAGLPPEERSRRQSLCTLAIERQEALVVDDLAADERLRDRLRGTAAESLRFYAGVPLLSPEGHALGTLCVLDDVPRHLT